MNNSRIVMFREATYEQLNALLHSVDFMSPTSVDVLMKWADGKLDLYVDVLDRMISVMVSVMPFQPYR